ncbi:fructosamine kinase family protein [Klebsiella pneumoniae subsp. pneumoniae]|nr:fructosamine kinase family protein [Klebsiella pneumoniae subsp. pneumoniae]
MWQAISTLLRDWHTEDAEIELKTELPGGEIHSAWHLRFGGKDSFVKCDDRELLPIFTAESDQLELLSRSKTVRVPQVFAVGSDRDYSFVVMEYLPPRPLDAHNAFLLGQQLAHLHQWSDQPQFGLDFDNDLSTTPQPNAWQRRWSVFFAEQRIGWQLELAAEKGLHFGDIDTLVDMVQQRLANHQPQPSLLHGDLWSGNCALGPDGPYIFDPACYWGDRECDLAMLPMHPEQPPQIYDGYQSVSPLPSGFLDRQPIYQLYTLLNRAILFGGQHLVTAQQALDDVLMEKMR